MRRRKTHEEFVAEVKALVGDEYEVLGEYLNAKTKIKLRHNKCNYMYDVSPSAFTSNGCRCPKCAGRAKKTTETFKQELFSLVGNEYSVLSEYKNNKEKIKVRHNECSYEYDVKPHNLLLGNRCPKCFGNIKKTTDVFKREVFELVGNEYSVLSEYKNNKEKIKVRHNECSYEYKVPPTTFLRGSRCPKCFGANKKSTEEFKQEVKGLVGSEYSVLSAYKDARTKIKIKHDKCGYIYNVKPNGFLNGTRCPKCNESKGEKIVAESLVKLQIVYARQYKFDDCRLIRPLPFDFIVFNADKTLKCLIEYDGEYHYKPMSHAGGKKGLRETQRRDRIKTQYCVDNNIPLIRIPYWDFDNIDEILTKELRKLGVIGVQDIAA